MVSTLIKQSQQDSQLAFYDHFVKGCLTKLKRTSQEVTLAIDAESHEFKGLLGMTKTAVTENQCLELSKRHEKYQQ